MILATFGDWVSELFLKLNDWLSGIVQFDEKILHFYETYVSPLSEWVKVIGAFIIAIIVIFGIFSLIKKAYKVVIVVAVIYAIFIAISLLTS